MLFSLFSVTLAILGARLGSASTSPDFLPAVAEDLQMFYGTTQVQPPGVTLSEATVANVPTLYASTYLDTSTRYAVIMVDYNVDLSGVQTTILQWFQPDLSAASPDGKLSIASGSSAPSASYISPAPNAGPAHQYVTILYKQPADYELPACLDGVLPAGNNRAGFNLQQFAGVAGLGDPIAANWFAVQDPTPATTTYQITATSTASYACATTA